MSGADATNVRARGSAFALGCLTAAACVIATASLILVGQGVLASLTGPDRQEPAPVLTAAVEIGQVITSVQGTLRLEPATVTSVPVPVIQEGALALVTAVPLTAGAEVVAGAVIAEVADRPVIALPGHIPAYRPLSFGAIGADVGQLQRALEQIGYPIDDSESTFGKSTARAVLRLYLERNLLPLDGAGQPVTTSNPDAVGIPLGEVAFVPALPAVLAASCGVTGVVVQGELCSIRSTAIAALIEVSAAEAAVLSEGLPVRVEIDREIAEGTLGAKLPTAAEEEGGPPAVVLYQFVTGSVLEESATGRSAAIVLEQSNPAVLIVPAAAISSSTTGAARVFIASADGTRAVSVSLGLCSGGVCEVTASDLREGEKVLLSAPDLPLDQ